MKRMLLSAFCLLLIVACTSCATETASVHVEGTLQELFGKIYAAAGVEAPMTMEAVLDDTNKASMLGTSDVIFTEGLATEAAIMTIPHSMVLLRVDEKTTDIEKTKQTIRDNIDPRKWICVGVDPDQVIVDSIGDLIFVVMSENAQAYHDSFLKLKP